ncbi:hypothetical protein E3Z27_04680 [Pseudomonas mediterranea]|uniref:DUF7683 domain-containing protein n=1 Tax=Pseudomonas mediterranea TaxID=183795 RepID=UPI0006D8B293|nr:hypothetical protein [Pseudomonas mediterranea]MBL0840969.1 hypothetical protein [Pseudomonas mediterranea]MDU9028344.1 hypothetical protein [Pseudomonas mediterranea]QHA81025.1 hypothetical protein E3Z27_04680 [Pseudomonas mediterranea]UZE01926.1 hypothetical protein LOY71_04660 [Pseudomonas mediterranea]
MKYIIEAFDKESDFLAFEIELPEGCDSQLAQIMGWSAAQRGDEGYNLNANQAAAIEALAGRQFYDADHLFQLTCNID